MPTMSIEISRSCQLEIKKSIKNHFCHKICWIHDTKDLTLDNLEWRMQFNSSVYLIRWSIISVWQSNHHWDGDNLTRVMGDLHLDEFEDFTTVKRGRSTHFKNTQFLKNYFCRQWSSSTLSACSKQQDLRSPD